MSTHQKSWLTEQRSVPIYITADDLDESGEVTTLPPFSPVEVVKVEVGNIPNRWRWKVTLPGNGPASENDDLSVGAICFTGLSGLAADVTGRGTFDLPTLARVDSMPEEFPVVMYAKKADAPTDAVLTDDEDDAMDGSPTFLVSGRKGDGLVMVDSHNAGAISKSIICRPKADVDTGEVMLCDVQAGPILLETDTGETIIAVNGGSLIASDTRCEAIHYSMRKGGEKHPLTGPEVSSILSVDAEALSSTNATQYAEYELFSLEC